MNDDVLDAIREVASIIETVRGIPCGTSDHCAGLRVEAMACVNFLRTHHATLADMAKRLEAAERDAARYRFIRDKQATIIYKRKGHGVWEPLIDTRETSTRCASLDEAVDAAIDATQEGEG